MKNYITKIAAFFIVLLSITNVFSQKNKFLEGKKYAVQFYEMKATGRGKALADVVTIKGGKIEDPFYELQYHCRFDIY